MPSTDICVIIEFVSKTKNNDSLSQTKSGILNLGWSMLDVSSSDRKKLYADLYEGTPRVLLWPNHLRVAKKGMRVEYQSMPLGGVPTLRRLVPANCVCGPYDLLPGLHYEKLPKYANSLLQASDDSMELKLLPTSQLYVNSCVVKIPENLEPGLLSSFKALYDFDASAEVSIYEYRLRVASHNQWTCINRSKLKNFIVLTQEGLFLRSNGIPSLDSVFVSPHISVIFQLECVLHVSLSESQTEIIPLTLGELVVLPSVDLETPQFLPLAVSEEFKPDSVIAGNPIWQSNWRNDDPLLLMCEVSPYQGSAEVTSTLEIVKAMGEKKKIEEEHKKQLKELYEKDKVRERELKKKEKELELKSRQVSAYSAYAKSSEPPSVPHTPIKTPLPKVPIRFPAEKPLREKEEVRLLEKPRQEMVILEAIGREIPRGDQVLLEEIGSKVISSPLISPSPVSIEENIQSALKACTVIFEFDSIKQSLDLIPENLAFSFQFYTFPLIQTEAVSIEKAANGEFGLKRVGSVKGWTNFSNKDHDTTSIKAQFEVDPEVENIERSFLKFISYLRENTCKVWIWNAETQIPVGFCKLGLADILRINEPQKIIKKECDIFSLEDATEEVIGTLCLTLQNIGRKESHVAKSKPLAVKTPSLNKRGKLKLKSKPLTTKDLSKVPQNDDKASLVYAYKEYSKHTQGAKMWEQESLISEYTKYRTFSRTLALAGMADLPPQKGMDYSLGELKIYPVQFINPYARETAFTATIHDPEQRTDVTMVTEPEEWKHYCKKLGIAGPSDWNALINEKFILKPYERLVLLFKVLALSPPKNTSRNVTITIYNGQTNSAEQANELFLLYHDSYHHSTYLLNVPENRSVDVSLPPDSSFEKFRNSRFLLCSDPNAEASIFGNKLCLTFSTPVSMNDTELYVTTYSDKYFLDHLCIFRINVRPYHCIDINETAGKHVAQSIILPGSKTPKELRLCSSNPKVVKLSNGYKSQIKLNEKGLTLPLDIASYKVVLCEEHQIDMQTNEVYKRWLIRVYTKMPTPGLKYEITATPQEISQASFEYANISARQKVYEVNSSKEGVLKIVQPTLVVQGGEKGVIKMHVAPIDTVQRQVQAFVYVTETSTGKTDTFLFSINYAF